MESDVNLEVDQELESYIDAVQCEENRKALQKMAVIFKNNQLKMTPGMHTCKIYLHMLTRGFAIKKDTAPKIRLS